MKARHPDNQPYLDWKSRMVKQAMLEADRSDADWNQAELDMAHRHDYSMVQSVTEVIEVVTEDGSAEDLGERWLQVY
jgi:hypothetical protein